MDGCSGLSHVGWLGLRIGGHLVLSLHSSNEWFRENFGSDCYTDITVNIITDIIRPHRSTTYVDVANCYRPRSVTSVVCLSVTVVSPAKTAELMGCPLGWPVEDLGGPNEWCTRSGYRSPWAGAILSEKGAARCEVLRLCAVSCAKMPELIEMPFGIWTLGGPEEPRIRWGADRPMQRCNF